MKGNKIVPIRSACAVLVSSQDANRQWVYTQQQTISAEGFAGTAFSPYFPHTAPLGQRLYVKSKYATSICSPSTMAIDPTRPRDPANQEQAIHPLYAFLYLTDAQEGLIVIGNPPGEKRNKPGVATLLDGDPENNFLKRALTYNPSGILKGARHIALHGHHAYVAADAGVVVLDLNNPLAPRHVTTLSSFSRPRKVAFQFRYAFVVDDNGLHVIDVTDPAVPQHRGTGVSPVIPIPDARDIYISRTYAYVAAGNDGLIIIDIERPEQPKIVQSYSADGKLNDVTAVRIGMTNASLFAYVANGRHGLAVLQLTSPDDNPTYGGFSPTPQPRLIARHKTKGRAVSISEGLDRDRAVDEAGNQLAVFGRLGARPFNREEQRRLYMKNDQLYTVTDYPSTEPLRAVAATPARVPATTPATQTQPPRRGIPPRRR